MFIHFALDDYKEYDYSSIVLTFYKITQHGHIILVDLTMWEQLVGFFVFCFK